MSDCVYCNPTNVYFRTENTFLILRDDQTLPGTSILATNEHLSQIGYATLRVQAEYIAVEAALEFAVQQLFGATHLNSRRLMNNSFAGTHNPDPHLHTHLAPRYNSPVIIGGEEFVDEHYPVLIKPETPREVSEVVRQEITKKLAKSIETNIRF